MSIICQKKTFALIACTILSLFNGICHAEEAEAEKVPTDFVRDVMQPIGVPVVTSFHTLRESLFLNAKIENGNALESMGDFFLIPSQYLFAGKKIVIKDDVQDCEVVQTFSYKRLHWLKTLVSIIALPVSEIIGATLKGLAYLSPEVRERHKKIKETLRSGLVKSHQEVFLQKGLGNFHCDEFIPCQGHKRPMTLTKKQKVEIQALKAVTELLDANNIIYWIDCGTCIGAYRYGGIIPWDWDIDISILLPDHDNVKNVLSKLDSEKYQIQDWSSYSNPKTFLKLYVKETKNFIDIYHYQINEQDRTVGYFFTYLDSPFPHSWKTAELKCMKPLKYEEMFPLKKAKFDNLTVWAPNNVVAFLQSKYGENLDPTMVWDEETKTYQKVADHPYYN